MKAVQPMKHDIPYRGLKYLEYYGHHKVYHPGWDFNRGVGNQDIGDPVYNFYSGRVEYVSPEPTRWNRYNGGFGWFVIVWHPAIQKYSRYAHLDKVHVKKDQKLKAGHHLGDCGNTGTTYAHLHWEVFGKEIADMNGPLWRFYPTNKSRAWVNDRYTDGLALIEELNKEKETGRDWIETHFPSHDSGIWDEEQCEFLRDYARKLKEWFA